jgi:hypothetical protein
MFVPGACVELNDDALELADAGLGGSSHSAQGGWEVLADSAPPGLLSDFVTADRPLRRSSALVLWGVLKLCRHGLRTHNPTNPDAAGAFRGGQSRLYSDLLLTRLAISGWRGAGNQL